MNILITGIHGFVGTNLVNALKAKHTIYGLDIVAPQKEGVIKTYTWAELEGISAVDVVIHLAGKAHDTKNQTNAQVYFDINTGLTQKIYDWFQASKAKKFIFFSSVKAAADRVEGDILTEDVVPCPKGPYGESKIAAENYILSKAVSSKQQVVSSKRQAVRSEEQETRGKNQESRTKNQDLREDSQLPTNNSLLQTTDFKLPTTNFPLSTEKKTYILRPCMIHGPGNKGNLNLLYQVVR